MRQFLGCLVSIGVVCALTTPPFAPAQEPEKKGAPGGQTTTVKTIVVQKGEIQKAKEEEPATTTVEVKKREVQKVQVVGKAVAGQLVVNMVPQVQQFTQQFRPILRAELHLVRTACELTEEQRKQVARKGEGILKDAATKYAESQQKMMQPRRAGQAVSLPDPRALIQEGILASLKTHLPPEQLARYQEEIDERAVNRKQLAVQNLVAKLDQDLVLSAEQRDRLGESLSSTWNDAWGQSLQMFMNIDQFFPNIPDKYVLPILNETQKKVWRNIPKTQANFWGGFGMFGGMMLEDMAGADEARKADPNQEGKE